MLNHDAFVACLENPRRERSGMGRIYQGWPELDGMNIETGNRTISRFTPFGVAVTRTPWASPDKMGGGSCRAHLVRYFTAGGMAKRTIRRRRGRRLMVQRVSCYSIILRSARWPAESAGGLVSQSVRRANSLRFYTASARFRRPGAYTA